MPPLASSVVDIVGTQLISDWIDSLAVVSGIGDYFSDLLPDDYKLYHAYPNPFNALTTISYDLPKTSQVELTIYDIRGREVAQLYHGKQPVGKYYINWKADENATGIYFYKLQTEDFIQVRKLVLVK